MTPRPSIAQAIFLLVLATLSVATAATFAIVFRGPPPRPAPIAITAVAAALRGGPLSGQPDRPRRPPDFERDHRPKRGDGPPPFFAPPRHDQGEWPAAPKLERPSKPEDAAPRRGERGDAVRDRLIEAALNARAGSVQGSYDEFGPRSRGDLFGGFTIRWRSPDGLRVVRTADQPLVTRWLMVTGATLLAAFLLLLIPAGLLARRISLPLRRLAAAADQARLHGAFQVPGGGPREVAALATAVGAMQRRIAGEAERRTTMLAAIAHDLGTPLSRIAFWLEQLPDTARDRANVDVDEMRAMLSEVLHFARDQRVNERTRVELGSILDSLVDDLASAGRPVSLTPGPRAVVVGDPLGLRRIFANLIENAIRYGERARVDWRVVADRVIVSVEDDGQGFDPALGDRVFEPFVRGDPSRNRATGGSGLGLAIVHALVDAHGGTVAIDPDAPGGRVTVALTLA